MFCSGICNVQQRLISAPRWATTESSKGTFTHMSGNWCWLLNGGLCSSPCPLPLWARLGFHTEWRVGSKGKCPEEEPGRNHITLSDLSLRSHTVTLVTFHSLRQSQNPARVQVKGKWAPPLYGGVQGSGSMWSRKYCCGPVGNTQTAVASLGDSQGLPWIYQIRICI